MKLINSKFQILLVFSFCIILNVSCQNQKAYNSGDYLINNLEKAENSKNLNLINSVYDENAILYTTELMPIKGKKAIISLYEFIFSRSDVENVKYIVDSAYVEKNLRIEVGRNVTKKVNQVPDTNEFKVVFQETDKEYQITEISFGKEQNIKREIPNLIRPTGKYDIGQSTFFYDKTKSGNDRLLSFQIWYPAELNNGAKSLYHNKEVVKVAANFLGLPHFMVSFLSRIKSNSLIDALAIANKKFPVLIYNHGYGGFTSVYQTIFEELVSHGYIVVSIGHENESALLILEDGSVIANDPQNEFYSNRAPELNGSEIGQWQDVILNSDELNENQKAYKEMIKLTPLHNESTRLWQSDTKVTIEKLIEINKTDKNLKGTFDFESVGVFGHSLGGATAGQLGFNNASIKAGINLDGFQFGDLINNKLNIPFMFVSSNQEGNRYLRASTFIENSEADCYQVYIEGFAHDNFTDLKYILEGNSEAINLQRELIKGFFDKYLKNEDVNLKHIAGKYEQLTLSEKNED
jgi:dienelactone hydrolase